MKAEQNIKEFLEACISDVLESATVEGVSEYALDNAEITLSKEDSETLTKKWIEKLKTPIQ